MGEEKPGEVERCPDGLTPDGPVCPRCGVRRGPSGVGGGTWVHWPEGTGSKPPAPAEGERERCPQCGSTDPIQHWYHPTWDDRLKAAEDQQRLVASLESALAASKAREGEQCPRCLDHGRIGQDRDKPSLKCPNCGGAGRAQAEEYDRDTWRRNAEAWTRRADELESQLSAAQDERDRYWANLVAYQAFDDRLTELLEGQPESKWPAGLHGRFVSYVERVVGENARLRAAIEHVLHQWCTRGTVVESVLSSALASKPTPKPKGDG